MEDSFTHYFNIFLSLGVIVYAFAIVFILCFKKTVLPLIKKYALASVFKLSIIAVVGSLLYAYVSGFAPCDLCWYQRIFLYSICFISFLGLIRRESFFTLKPYLMLLTVMGGIIAFIHNIIYYVGYNPLPCSANASCTARYVFEFGFITIPLMSLITFLFIFVILTLVKKDK